MPKSYENFCTAAGPVKRRTSKHLLAVELWLKGSLRRGGKSRKTTLREENKAKREAQRPLDNPREECNASFTEESFEASLFKLPAGYEACCSIPKARRLRF